MSRYWSDLQPGETFATGQLTLDREAILDFAAEFDPQPYHLDNAAAEDSIFGGLCASGWQVTALMMRLLTDTLHQQGVPVMGIDSVPSLRWKAPVFVDDTLQGKVTIRGGENNSRQAGCGRTHMDITVHNQDGRPVIELNAVLLVAHGEHSDAA
ncbi:MaoC/PaaZ C-terminal domain-containing protein [Parahaliea mediterranea]|uniref:MaoC family dehydratase N-terminal domain-containing protein n=1 Tax=Parahaliea mediterranea TaxID=651086 RepID=A0A939DH30_9GAMM|nr:MaoC/PaaZ C-terminal domain-containing protein [Parahaliea mediterranea]MBN7797377.1 MaoC family dehydratase N-terminal domain-containing protein [Parahaliea mediterranea]